MSSSQAGAFFDTELLPRTSKFPLPSAPGTGAAVPSSVASINYGTVSRYRTVVAVLNMAVIWWPSQCKSFGPLTTIPSSSGSRRLDFFIKNICRCTNLEKTGREALE